MKEWTYGIGFTTDNGSENLPRNILEEIVWHKDKEIQKMKEKVPLAKLMQMVLVNNHNAGPPVRDFVAAIRNKQRYLKLQNSTADGAPPPPKDVALIAECKKASPSKGLLQPSFDADLINIASGYQNGGASALSVLTDSKYFMGSYENIRSIRTAQIGASENDNDNGGGTIDIPILAKEFIIEGYQIFKARSVGADAFLLIAAVLSNEDLNVRE